MLTREGQPVRFNGGPPCVLGLIAANPALAARLARSLPRAQDRRR